MSYFFAARQPEVAGRHVDDAVRDAEFLHELLLDREQVLMLVARVFRPHVREHLDLVELVSAEHAARVVARRAGLAAEARRVAGVAERQVVGDEDLLHVQAGPC